MFWQVAAKAFTFIFALTQTTSLTASYFLHEVAKNSNVQQKVHAELDHLISRLDQHNGQRPLTGFSMVLDCWSVK